MKNSDKNALTVSVIVNAPIEKVFEAWTKPEHIVKWNFASDDWHCPNAENDLKIGGKFCYTMAAKDGSVSFDFEGRYTLIVQVTLIESLLDDGREVSVVFETKGNQTLLTERFEPESENTLELQQLGWQSILNNFKKYVESFT